MAQRGFSSPKYTHVHNYTQTDREEVVAWSIMVNGMLALSRDKQKTEQRHVATQINAGEEGDDVEVVSIAYAKSLKCHARDFRKTNNRCGGMNLGKSVNHQVYTHVHAYIQTG